MSDSLEEITKEVYRLRPVLLEIVKKYSKFSLQGYVKNEWAVPKATAEQEFLNIVQEEALKIYGKDIALGVINQLKQKPLISTISHMGIWGHPIFVNADLIYSLHFGPTEFAISLATESVSLNNTSSWSGSVLCHSGGQLQRFSFFPDAKKTFPVFSAPPVSKKEIELFKNRMGKQSVDLIETLNFDVSSNFSEQCCKSSAQLWQSVFPSAPKLLYLPLETIVSNYLIKALENKENIFYKIITSADGQNLWRKYFNTEHTFMFWGIDSKGRRRVLERLPEVQELISLIKNRQVYASSPLCFAVLLFAGLACVGGFTQTTWLTQTKEKFLQLLAEMVESSVAENIAGVPTKNFAESSLAWLNINGGFVTPTATDLFLTKKDYYPLYKKLAQKITLGQSLNLAMADIYSVVVSKSNQSAELNEIRNRALESQLTELEVLL